MISSRSALMSHVSRLKSARNESDLATMSSNPYESSSVFEDKPMPMKPRSCWHGFKTGFRNGTLWSLLLFVPTVPAFYGEMTMHRRIQRTSTNRTSRVSQLSSVESAFAWLGAIGTALTFITLPWAITAGCVGARTVSSAEDHAIGGETRNALKSRSQAFRK